MKIKIYKNCSKYLSNILLTSNNKHWLQYNNQNIDLILDGGAFSGSYLLGGLIYIENISNHINISRISGTSVGSLFGLLFLSKLLCKYNYKFYKKFRKCFKKNGDLSVLKDCLDFIRKHIHDDFYKSCNNIFYITYFNIIDKKQIIRYTYSGNDDLLSSVYKSCFIPLIINGKISYENKYIDGVIPHIFPEKKDRKVLFMDLHSNYLSKMINIKNETTNNSRILTGIFETHQFFMYGNSNLCFDIYYYKYYYKFIIFLRQYIAIKVISLLSIIQSFYYNKNDTNNSNDSNDKNHRNTLYYYITFYIIRHLKKIFPHIIKYIANSYLV